MKPLNRRELMGPMATAAAFSAIERPEGAQLTAGTGTTLPKAPART
jgi:hypothetical protein